jgi:hypothetical protein
MINDKDGHIPSPLRMFACTALPHALLEWQKNKGVHPIASKSKLKADRPDRLNYLNHKNDGGKNTSCCPATGSKLLTSPGVADTFTFLKNTWKTLPECYQQRVNKHTLASVKREIQQAENQMPTMVISVESVCVDNAIHLAYLTSEVALEERGIGSTDPHIPIGKNCTDDEQHLGMPGGSGHYEDEGEQSDEGGAMPMASQQRPPVTELERFDQRTSDVDGYKGVDGDNADADADEQEEASQATDGSMQNVVDRGHSR